MSFVVHGIKTELDAGGAGRNTAQCLASNLGRTTFVGANRAKDTDTAPEVPEPNYQTITLFAVAQSTDWPELFDPAVRIGCNMIPVNSTPRKTRVSFRLRDKHLLASLKMKS